MGNYAPCSALAAAPRWNRNAIFCCSCQHRPLSIIYIIVCVDREIFHVIHPVP